MSQTSTGLGKLSRHANIKAGKTNKRLGIIAQLAADLGDNDLDTKAIETKTDNKSKALIKFKHLQQRGIVNSFAQLKNLIDRHGFPSGFFLGSNSRVWFEADIDEWIANRPTTQRAAQKEAKHLSA